MCGSELGAESHPKVLTDGDLEGTVLQGKRTSGTIHAIVHFGEKSVLCT